MFPKDFKDRNGVLTGPDGLEDKNVLPLPVHRNGYDVTSCWEFSDEEIEEIVRTRAMYIRVSSGVTSPPIWASVFNPVEQHKEAFCELLYRAIADPIKALTVWIAGDFPAPLCVDFNGTLYRFDAEYKPRFNPRKQIFRNDHYIRPAQESEIDQLRAIHDANMASVLEKNPDAITDQFDTTFSQEYVLCKQHTNDLAYIHPVYIDPEK